MRAEARGVPVIDNANIDAALAQAMELVLDSIAEVGSSRR
jgi:2-phosphoglycerate kinase